MFGTIRRHQKWLWVVISGVTIVSFVAFFSPQQRRQRGWTGPHDQVGAINGRPINRDQYASAQREAALQYVFNYGQWPGEDAMSRQAGLLERETRNRIVLLNEVSDLDIEVSDSAVAQWIAEAFRDRSDKTFRKDAYDQFVKTALPSHGLSLRDFENFARHQVAIQHVVSLAGTAGKLVTPQEAEALFRHENEEIEAEAVFINSSNYTAQVTSEPTAVATYYTNHLADYRIPEKIQLNYVKFAATNYTSAAEQDMAKNTNLTQYVDTVYQQRGTNSFKDTNNAVMSTEAAKQKIRGDLRESLSLEEAWKKAVEFLNEVGEVKEKTNALENLAAAKSLVSEVTEPFGQFEMPRGLKVPSTFSQTAAKLTPEEPIAEEPVRGEDAVFVIALKQRIPSEIPPLDSIRDRVTQDYVRNKALELARGAGNELHTNVVNGLDQSKNFDAVLAEKNITPVVLAPFSRKTTVLPGVDRTDVSQLVNTAFTVAPGKVSSFAPTRTGGFMVYVKKIVPVSDERVKVELPEFTQNLRQTRQYEAFSEWFRKLVESAHLVLQGDKQRASAQ
jgi:hypothetical protein